MGNEKGGGGATNITVLFHVCANHVHASTRTRARSLGDETGCAGTGCVMRFVRHGGGVATTLPRSQQYALDGFV